MINDSGNQNANVLHRIIDRHSHVDHVVGLAPGYPLAGAGWNRYFGYPATSRRRLPP
ncbi:MAG: hypothetical protein IIC99_04180 [Chloroflexi bacterium]|nr:hypothetical protein [Chloroflexota bacterium]